MEHDRVCSVAHYDRRASARLSDEELCRAALTCSFAQDVISLSVRHERHGRELRFVRCTENSHHCLTVLALATSSRWRWTPSAVCLHGVSHDEWRD